MKGRRYLFIGALALVLLGLVIGFWPHHDGPYACGSAFNPQRKLVGIDGMVIYPNLQPCHSAHLTGWIASGFALALGGILALAALLLTSGSGDDSSRDQGLVTNA